MRTLFATCTIIFAATTSILPAQTLQLPSFHTFSADTTMLVPDRGAMILGGMGGRSAGEARFGECHGNRAIGSNTYASRSSVTAVIHDLDPDDQILPRQNR